jgi:hypothetical protein
VLVESRSCIRPTFRLPLGEVFPVSQMVHPRSQNKNPAGLLKGRPIDLADVQSRAGEIRRGVLDNT